MVKVNCGPLTTGVTLAEPGTKVSPAGRVSTITISKASALELPVCSTVRVKVVVPPGATAMEAADLSNCRSGSTTVRSRGWMPGVTLSASKSRVSVPLGPVKSRLALLPNTVPSWLPATLSTVTVMSTVIRSSMALPLAGLVTVPKSKVRTWLIWAGGGV